MTIKGIADELGTTSVTIYRRLKRAGIQIATLRDDNGDITQSGASTIANLFRERDADVQRAIDAGRADRSEAEGLIDDDRNRLQREAASAETRAVIAETRLEFALERVKALESDLEHTRLECSRLLALLEAEQQQRQRLLTDGHQQRRGLFRRLRRD